MEVAKTKRDLSTLAGRLRFFARQHHGSVRQLSIVTGINYTQLTDYSDEKPPGGLTMQRLIEAGLNGHWLFTGTGPMLANTEEQFEKPPGVARVRPIGGISALGKVEVAPASTLTPIELTQILLEKLQEEDQRRHEQEA